jgi:predicted enzyme related to lactoylglutathione lyase
VNALQPRLNLLVIRSADIQRAAAFYGNIGLQMDLHAHGGPEHYTSQVDGAVFEIYPLGRAQPTTTVRLGFAVGDVDGLVPVLIRAGGAVIEAPHDSPWGRRAVIADHDGHRVELLTVRDHEAPESAPRRRPE